MQAKLSDLNPVSWGKVTATLALSFAILNAILFGLLFPISDTSLIIVQLIVMPISGFVGGMFVALFYDFVYIKVFGEIKVDVEKI